MTQQEQYLTSELEALTKWLQQPLNPQLKEIVEKKLAKVKQALQK